LYPEGIKKYICICFIAFCVDCKRMGFITRMLNF
jgi:hypothetical protein